LWTESAVSVVLPALAACRRELGSCLEVGCLAATRRCEMSVVAFGARGLDEEGRGWRWIYRRWSGESRWTWKRRRRRRRKRRGRSATGRSQRPSSWTGTIMTTTTMPSTSRLAEGYILTSSNRCYTNNRGHSVSTRRHEPRLRRMVATHPQAAATPSVTATRSVRRTSYTKTPRKPLSEKPVARSSLRP